MRKEKWHILKILLSSRDISRFLIAVICGLSFSLAVILATLSLMDGYSRTVLKALKHFSDHTFTMIPRQGFFYDMDNQVQHKQENKTRAQSQNMSEEKEKISLNHVRQLLKEWGVQSWIEVLQTEGQLVNNHYSQGITLIGLNIQGDIFPREHPLFLFKTQNDIHIKEENCNFVESLVMSQFLANRFKVEKGNSLNLVLLKSQGLVDKMIAPVIIPARVADFFNYDLYQKDLRFVQLPICQLANWTGTQSRVNKIYASMPLNLMISLDQEWKDQVSIEKMNYGFQHFLKFLKIHKDSQSDDYKDIDSSILNNVIIKPFWYEMSHELKAVSYQKFLIGTILQIIVVVSVFNALGLVLYIRKSRSKIIFILRALGLSQNALNSIWILFLFLLVVLSNILGTLFFFLIKMILEKTQWFYIPSSVYKISQLPLPWIAWNHVLVFCLSLLWIMLLSYFILFSKKSLQFSRRDR